MRILRHLLAVCAVSIAVGLFIGCASSSSKTKSSGQAPTEKTKKKSGYDAVANPPTVKFGEFQRVQVKASTLAPRHADHKGNQGSATKIDQMLQEQLRVLFSEVKAIPAGQDFLEAPERTLLIEPHIKEIRLISGGTRFWLGVMAGGSDLLMQVTYRDSSTGEVIANPEFAEGNNAWSGSWSMGATDNRMRDEIVMEIMGYMSANK